jgi:pyruvate:ferredoxin (flavodoxin) oxidoreductase, homodimeric
MVTIDGNEAAAYIAFKTNEVCAIYPITPSSPMGELADKWSSEGKTNAWGAIPTVAEMQSEGGASGAVHGALQTGALTTTFTSSQGLLLMIPNMYKIAGELTSTVFYVASRSVAAQALSIFGDHSDVMAVRSTGFAMLSSANAQEVMDLGLIAQAATLQSRVPFLHWFDGFRTSHEIRKIEQLTDEDIRTMIKEEWILAHRERAMNPDNPFIRGTAQNPDVFFQGRETVNPYYAAVPGIVQRTMDQFAELTGRQYHLFDYVGSPEAEQVIIIMGSGSDTVHETVEYLNARGANLGVLKVRLFRPFDGKALLAALPQTVKAIAVLDRTKEPGSAGEPLYLDVVTAINESRERGELPFREIPNIIGGRYGLSSKEFTPAMVKGIFDELEKERPKNHFTIGIIDDVSHTSLDFDENFSTESEEVFRGVFFGLGSDGTVGANKNSIKIIGTETDNYAQGYFVYDSKKAGSTTISHLRFGRLPIRSTYLIREANFVACHQFELIHQFDVLKIAVPGATFLLNSPYGPDEVWNHLPRHYQKQILDKRLKFYVIDALKVALDAGMGGRINTIMQTCFFAISGILPKDEAIAKIKQSIEKTYGLKGEDIVRKNFAAVDAALAHLHEVEVPDIVTGTEVQAPIVPPEAPKFVQEVTAKLIAGLGDELPVSAMPADGTWPVGTTKWEKRNIAHEVPVWEPELCIQCNKCALVCPHATIRPKVVSPESLKDAPPTLKHIKVRGKEWGPDDQYILQVAVEDCTGCRLCVEACPAVDKQDPTRKAINMAPQRPLREAERVNWAFFEALPEVPRNKVKHNLVKGSQFLEPLFEFSGACSGCGETPYIKLATQLFGDRMLVANATGCSSIYGGNLPTTPWTKNKEGRGPSWSNSLFEDNAEFGLGFRLTLDSQAAQAKNLLQELRDQIGAELVNEILNAVQVEEAEIRRQWERVEELKSRLAKMDDHRAKWLLSLADSLVKKSVWIIGGDGWAYDIGYGGLDHVLASGRDVNILVLDTEVYSNTGGQTSKATPLGAVAKFSAGGKPTPKKELGLMAMSYRSVYVAQVAMGASDAQTVRAFIEAEAYPGPSLIIAYSHCIAHGIDMSKGLEQQKLAVESGLWPLYRFNPTLLQQGKNPLKLDSKPPRIHVKDYAYNETRFRMLSKIDPKKAAAYIEEADRLAKENYRYLQQLASLPGSAELEAAVSTN